MKQIAIIGGGISGLSAAYYLEKARRDGADLQWTLLEKSGRFGGVLRTEHYQGHVMEAGADSFLTAKPEASKLCRELGIADQMIPSNDSDRKTYIVVNGRLVPIPDGLQFMVPTRIWPLATTPLFSFGTKLRMMREWFTVAGSQAEDESVASFVRRHFGQEMVDRVAEPMLAGVFGGNAEKLSVRATLARFVEMERSHGSLAKATLKARQSAPTPSSQQPLFTSLKNGMQQLIDALVAALPASSLRTNQEVCLRRVGNEWRVNGAKFDHVLIAVPAPVVAALLTDISPEISTRLQTISYTSSAAVALGYTKIALPPGHGFLVPGSEKRKLLACTFVHRKFSFRAPEGRSLLRCFFSNSRMADVMERSDDDLQMLARQELKDILGLDAQPDFTHTFRWGRALAQYEVGHLERAAEIESYAAKIPGLHLAGNSLYGVGIPDCVKSAKLAAEKVVAATAKNVEMGVAPLL